MPSLPKVSDDRAKIVMEEIVAGSDLHVRFSALLITASMIACFGLTANSTAVIIGAMLVSPLMTPIFGVALGMLQGNASLLGRALATEAVGVAMAVIASWLVGAISFQFAAFDATPEMLSRTEPTLLDLLVAVFAGFAGAYALIDDRISPALPGVAIATAIVPPLATSGLCLSLGEWSAALGAFLLFLANFVSILIVALLTFAIGGLARPERIDSWRVFGRRFGLPIVTFVLITIVLTNSLIRIADEKFVTMTLHETLKAEFANDLAVDLETFQHNVGQERIEVLATVRAPRVVKSSRVTTIQESLSSATGRPVDLVVRTVLAKDVAPSGSYLQVRQPELSGSFLTQRTVDLSTKEILAEQVLRERFEGEPGFELTNVNFGVTKLSAGIVLAYIDSIRRLSPVEIEAAERKLREAIDDPTLVLYVRINSNPLISRERQVRVEWANWRNASVTQITHIAELENTIREKIRAELSVIPVNVHLDFRQDRLGVLVEVVGPNPVAPDDATRLQQEISKELSLAIELHFWYRNDYVVNSNGYTTFERISDPQLRDRAETLKSLFESRAIDVSDPTETSGGQ